MIFFFSSFFSVPKVHSGKQERRIKNVQKYEPGGGGGDSSASSGYEAVRVTALNP